MIVTSELGAAVAAVVARHALEGRPIGLNLFGDTLAMPLSTVQDGAVPGVGGNPLHVAGVCGKNPHDSRLAIDRLHPPGPRRPVHDDRDSRQRLLARQQRRADGCCRASRV